jgi:hypothetical protein
VVNHFFDSYFIRIFMDMKRVMESHRGTLLWAENSVKYYTVSLATPCCPFPLLGPSDYIFKY